MQPADCPYGVEMKDFEDALPNLIIHDEGASWQHSVYSSWQVDLFPAPPLPIRNQVIQHVGENAKQGIHVEVSFDDIQGGKHEKEIWSGHFKDSSDYIRIELGPSGANSKQELKLGLNTENSALIIGQSGSGKSNLMHVIILGLALKYPPSELELYLVDFKGGVEFKDYANYRLPHARAIAIESEREFGISILEGLSKQMAERERIFKLAKVSDYP